jgi:hypothetical protein
MTWNATKSLVAPCLAFGLSFSSLGEAQSSTATNSPMIVATESATTTTRRFPARYPAKHIPGQPTIVAEPATGGEVAAPISHAQAPRDGTVFGSFPATSRARR